MKNSPKENNLEINRGQFLVLIFLNLIILGDTLPVLVDRIIDNDNYRLHDGFGDAVKGIIYFFATLIVLITMRFRKNKIDFLAVLFFCIGIMICIPLLGIHKFITIVILSLSLIIYMILSFKRKLKNNPKINNASH
ncbi:hypothetical protein [Flavobacterium rhamnosiphilum]|uniref:hypothetical protein n=1 Tax=Flavobacterium rhamnosiphilum TaxID=2541724 RepID=UPI0014044548|nr:hypothetical protein [Flavobacterium rhamnosiphilum]